MPRFAICKGYYNLDLQHLLPGRHSFRKGSTSLFNKEMLFTELKHISRRFEAIRDLKGVKYLVSILPTNRIE